MIEKQSYNFIRIGGCNSCHSQDLASVAAAFARSRGFAAPQIPQLPQSMMPAPERLIDFGFVAVSGIGVGALRLRHERRRRRMPIRTPPSG